MDNLNPETLAELRAAEQAATKGPWRAEMDGSMYTIRCIHPSEPWRDYSVCIDPTGKDANFIALARNNMPALLDRLGWLQEELQTIEELCQTLMQVDVAHENIMLKTEIGDLRRELDQRDAAERRLESACLSLADLERQLDHLPPPGPAG